MRYSLITARTAHSMHLAQDQAWFANIFVPLDNNSHLVCRMSHPWWFSHAPSSMSTSSSSPVYPTTQREQSVHPAPLQAHSVDKLRHQASLWPAKWRKPAHNNSRGKLIAPVTVPWCRREARRSQAYADLFSVTLHDVKNVHLCFNIFVFN